MTANVIPFNFESNPVRTLLIDDQPWFVASDIAIALDYREAKDMTRNLDEDEKGRQIVPTLGGDQELSVINESGLYSAILRSRKPEAKKFKKWVTAEVLPTIRKHSQYQDTDNRMATLLGQTIGTDGFHVLGALIKGKVNALPGSVRRRAASKLWAQCHAAFGVRSAADIPADQMDSARNFIAAYALEGEFLPKPAAKDSALELDDHDLQALHIVMTHFGALARHRLGLQEVARLLDSKVLSAVGTHIQEGTPHFVGLHQRYGQRLAQLQEARLSRSYAG